MKDMLNNAISSIKIELLGGMEMLRSTLTKTSSPPELQTAVASPGRRSMPDIPRTPIASQSTSVKTITPLTASSDTNQPNSIQLVPSFASTLRHDAPPGRGGDGIGSGDGGNGGDGFQTVPPRGRTKSTSAEMRQKAKTPLRSRSKIVIGKRVNDGQISWRGADMTVSRYIGNVDMEAQSDDIRTFIEGKGVRVIELEQNTTQHQRFKSFRLCIKKGDIEKIDNPDFWPQDVKVRQYFRPRTSRTTGSRNQWRQGATDNETDSASTVQAEN